MSSQSSSMAPEASVSQRNPRQTRCSISDYACIVTWLEDRNNFNSLYGAGKRPKIDGNIGTKSKMLEKLAVHVNENSQNRLTLTGPLMYQRLRHYRLQYIRALEFLKQTEARFTEGDKKKGILTVSQKLESICPFFDRMDKIFGDKPNLEPHAEEDSSLQREIFDIGTAIGAVVEQGSRREIGVGMEEELEVDGGLQREEDIEEGSRREEAEEIIEISDTVPPSSVERRPNRRPFSIALEEGLENGRAAPKRRRTDENVMGVLGDVRTLEGIAWEKEKFRLMEKSAERSQGIDLENAKTLRLLELEEMSRLKEKEMNVAAKLKEKEVFDLLKADLARQTSKARLDLLNSLFAKGASDEEIDRHMKIFKKYSC